MVITIISILLAVLLIYLLIKFIKDKNYKTLINLKNKVKEHYSYLDFSDYSHSIKEYEFIGEIIKRRNYNV